MQSSLEYKIDMTYIAKHQSIHKLIWCTLGMDTGTSWCFFMTQTKLCSGKVSGHVCVCVFVLVKCVHTLVCIHFNVTGTRACV